MNSTLTLSYVHLSTDAAQLIELNQDGTLTRKYYLATAPTTETQLIHPKCLNFYIAADKQNLLHLLVVSKQHQLTYCQLNRNEVRTLPFAKTQAPEHYLMAYGSNGIGFYCGQGEGKISIAVSTAAQKWEFTEKKLGTKPAPLGLAVDQAGYAHLLLYDLIEDTLWYITIEPRQYRCSSPLQLATRIKMNIAPAFLFDSVQNIHIAWVSNVDQQLHYRARLAGGWPIGGWQQEFSIPLYHTARLISFSESYPHPEIWILDETKLIHYYSSTDAAEKKQQPFTDNLIPLRVARPSSTDLRLFSVKKDTPLLESLLKEKAEEQIVTNTTVSEEEDNPFFLHARRLLNEKKRLEFEVGKREASLAQLHHMLELSQENVKRQTILLNERYSGISTKVNELQQNNSLLEAKCQELQEYANRYHKSQKGLEQAEVTCGELKQQLTLLRNELAAALQREKELLLQFRRLEEELATKKGLWESISYMFHKKPSSHK